MTGLTFVATGKGSKTDPTKAELRVAQPELRIATVGPDMNFVERDGIYTITIDNAGEVDVNNVQVEFAIPGGVKVNTISRPAKMDARRNTLTWNFEKIDAATQQVIQIKSIANEEGEKISSITIDSDETTEKTISLTTMIVTRADLSIRMKTVGGPVQVGTPTDFIVYSSNFPPLPSAKGSKSSEACSELMVRSSELLPRIAYSFTSPLRLGLASL